MSVITTAVNEDILRSYVFLCERAGRNPCPEIHHLRIEERIFTNILKYAIMSYRSTVPIIIALST